MLKRVFYTALGSFLLLPVFAADALGLTLQDFREQVFRPENLPAGREGDASVETKISDIFQFATNFILYASGSVAVLMIVLGAVQYVTSLGNQERTDAAKKTLQFAVTGLLVVILVYALITNVIDLIYEVTVS